MSDQFVHLHVHTEYSMLDGAAKLGPLFEAAAKAGQPALAMTDHGFMFGAYDFFTTAKKYDVKPIIGIEAYLAPGQTHRSEKKPVKWAAGGEDDVSGGGAYTHMTLLAETTEGMHNLFRLASLASIEGFYRKPRMDRELLHRYGKGIIATTGCPSGEIQTLLRMGRYEQARDAAVEFRDIFGADNFYCELMDHGIGIEKRAHEGLLRLAKDLNLPLVATNDLHYTAPEDAAAHDALLAVQSGSQLSDPNRFKFDAQDFYLKTAAEMRQLWGQFPEACDNTLLIAERCNVTFNEGANLMPRFPVPDGETEESWFVKEVNAGLRRRYNGTVPADRQAQADYEVGVILQMGFPGYFLVTADFIAWAKSRGIRVGPGRGSAAGSLVAYAMGITELDPMVHGLLFERFLNPERVSMPDIDVDFDERRRGEVIQYVTDKYGDDRVAQIITFGTIKAKAAVKDSARILGYPFGVGDKITKAMPPDVMGKGVPLSGIFDPDHPRYAEAGEFRSLYEQDADVRKVVETAKGLEGLKRQWGVHAAGVILSSEPLIGNIAVMKREQDGAIITQFDQGTCETLGLLKMDFLGLRNLTVIDDCIKSIKANRGIDVDLDEISQHLDDPKAYEILAKGDTSGVFQVEGGGIRSLLRLMAPDNFEDISAVLALYRPGPMGANAHIDYADRKNGRKPVVPIHPELEEPLADILGDTHGLIVYQEQVMAIAQKLAGYSLGAADLLRRAMGKKKKEILDKEFIPFSDGMKANGYSAEAIQTLWDILVPFSDYAFNKAHTAGYGLVTYWTAYLKANFRTEYMAALLTSVRDDKDKSAIFLNECRKMGIKVLPPDVNESEAAYTPVGDDIRVGLEAIRNVGGPVVEAIARSRAAKGKFTDFADFLSKIELGACNKRVIESLIKAGAFDSLGHTRRGLVQIHADAVDQYISVKKNEANGQDSLFGSLGDDTGVEVVTIRIPEVEEWDKKTLLAEEREMLGLYVSDHPLNGMARSLAAKSDVTIGALIADESRRAGSTVTISGLLTSVTRKITKRGDTWAILQVEDLEGGIEVLCFPSTYQQLAEMLIPDAVLSITGRVDRKDDGAMSVNAQNAVPIQLINDGDAPFELAMPHDRAVGPLVEKIRNILQSHPGQTAVHLSLLNGRKVQKLALSDDLRVTVSTGLIGDLKAVLGPSCIPGNAPRAIAA